LKFGISRIGDLWSDTTLEVGMQRFVNIQQTFFALLGLVPIGCLCLALFGLLPLAAGTIWMISPALALACLFGLSHPQLGRRALRGLIGGILATALYDCVRFPLVLASVWADFIPTIGRMLFNDAAASPLWGYAWRDVLNGGAMGITFALASWPRPRSAFRALAAGLIYGLSICGGLFVTLWLAPGAQALLFHLTWSTALAALLGHALYGIALAWYVNAWTPDPAVARLGAVILHQRSSNQERVGEADMQHSRSHVQHNARSVSDARDVHL
jgi:hypothetical protein